MSVAGASTRVRTGNGHQHKAISQVAPQYYEAHTYVRTHVRTYVRRSFVLTHTYVRSIMKRIRTYVRRSFVLTGTYVRSASVAGTALRTLEGCASVAGRRKVARRARARARPYLRKHAPVVPCVLLVFPPAILPAYVRAPDVRTHVRAYTCVLPTYVRTCVCTYVRTYVCTYVRRYVRTYVRT